MPYTVDFTHVSTTGLESSPVAPRARRLTGQRGPLLQEQVRPRLDVGASERGAVDHRVGEPDSQGGTGPRHLVPPLEATAFQVENIRMAYVFYQSGLSINVMYTIDDAGKRAVGLKLSDGMEVPEELASQFKFARQKSKLAGTIPRFLLRHQKRVLTPGPTSEPDTGPGNRVRSTRWPARPPSGGSESARCRSPG